jgi:hypothetical protein
LRDRARRDPKELRQGCGAARQFDCLSRLHSAVTLAY